MNTDTHQLNQASLRDALIARAWQHRNECISALQTLVDELPSGRARKQVEQLIIAWKDCESEQDIQNHPQILEWITCFVQPDSAQSRARMQRFVDRVAVKQESSHRILHMVAYPILLVALATAVLLFYCFSVVPEFDLMYQEFGLNLPQSTILVLSISRFLTGLGGRAITIGILLLLGLCWYLVCFIRGAANAQLRRTGIFAWRIGRQRTIDAFYDLNDLMAIGLHHDEAVQMTEDRFSGRFYREEESDPQIGLAAAQMAALPASLRSLLNAANDHQNQSDKSWTGPESNLNQQLSLAWAHVYEDRTRYRSHRHWFALFDSMIKIAVGTVIGFVIIALFSPLVSLITGLT